VVFLAFPPHVRGEEEKGEHGISRNEILKYKILGKDLNACTETLLEMGKHAKGNYIPL